MKKILLVSNYTFHYRVGVYNYLFDRFKEHGFEFILLTEGIDIIQDQDIKFNYIVERFSIIKYLSIVKTINPQYLIEFLHLKDSVNFPIAFYCKLKRIPLIFWNKGVNIKTPNNYLKNLFYYLLHILSDRIVLYTPNELKFLLKFTHKKVSIGYNTLSFEDVNKLNIISKESVCEKYGITVKDFLLFAATIKNDKMLDTLLDNPCGIDGYGVVIAGRGISQKQKDKIRKLPNYFYLGEIPHDQILMNSLFAACHVFSTPGDLGLALVQAFFWGKPVIALDVAHSVEVYYLRHNYNGYLAKNMNDYWSKVSELKNNDETYNAYVNNINITFQNEVHIQNMFDGFNAAINAIDKRKND